MRRAPKRERVYIGTCRCGEVLHMINHRVGCESDTADGVAIAIMRGLTISSMTDAEYRANPVGLGGCHCERPYRPIKRCAWCASNIYENGEEFGYDGGIAGNVAIIHMHNDCYELLSNEEWAMFLHDFEWGSGERPEGKAKRYDEAREARDREIANGQLEMAL